MAQIKTFARLKPSKRPYSGYKVCSKKLLKIEVPENKDLITFMNTGQNIRSNMTYDISFNNIFEPEATQEEVFDGVAKDIIQNFLNGYNGTIFAYGQTGTGKTYTVEGNSCRYDTRGLATRALSMIYRELENRTEEHISVYLSYLEIYQEVAYDLLNPGSRTILPMIPFAKVTVVEGPRATCILRGLSLHLAANEEVAQMLLLQGQANRHVAETPVNMRSSRSHGVFSVYLQARRHDSQVILSSKLHLVDLAGSERVSKTGVEGQQLTEAKSINLSLHHLETVIIALQTERTGERTGSALGGGERERGEGMPTGSKSVNSFMSNPSSDTSMRNHRFVPYRNSLLTMILRDSLGGNCLTAMIATISLEPENLGESISTCRFAQRVARIANFARKNEEVDDKVLIKRLKKKVAELENQVALLRSKSITGPVTDEEVIDTLSDHDRITCANVMEEYLQGVINDPVSAGICRVNQFRECLNLLRHRFQKTGMVTGNLDPVEGPKPVYEAHRIKTHIEERHHGGAHIVQTANEEEDVGSSKSSHEIAWTSSSQPTQSSVVEPADPSVRQLANTNRLNTAAVGLEPRDKGHSYKSQNVSTQIVPPFQPPPSPPPPPTPPPEKSMDDVEHLLLELTKSSAYKSPYERKREKEIKKLGKRLNSMEEKKMVKEEELQLMKQDMVLQSLHMEEDGMKLKLQVSDEQVADQHAYLLQLKHLQADPELITREILVEKQLRKRQAKFRDKLNDIQERKEGVERELSQMHHQSLPGSAKHKLSFEEKFGQFKQGKGALNTRQVFEILKNEEKRQKKDVGNMEREKTLVKTKQLELKEIATLEKLRELKQILKMSQKYNMNQDAYTPEAGHVRRNVQNPDMASTTSNFNTMTNSRMEEPQGTLQENLHSSKSEHVVNLESDSYLKKPPSGKEDKHMHERKSENMVAVDVSDAEENHDKKFYQSQLQPSSKQSRQTNGSTVMNGAVSGSLANYLSNQNNANSMAYQQSPRSLNSFENGKSSQGEQKYESVEACERTFSDSEIPPRNFRSAAHDTSTVRNINNSYNDSRMEENISCIHNRDEVEDLQSVHKLDNEASASFTPMNRDTVGTSAKNAQWSEDIKTKPSSGTGDGGRDLKLSDLEKLSASEILDSLKPFSDRTSNLQGDNSSVHPQHVLPPSEYINFMMTKEGFDARRMGLSSRTFESALSHMLESDDKKTNVPELPYSQDPYEQYSRTSATSNHSLTSKHSKKLSPYESSHSSGYSSWKSRILNDTSTKERKAISSKNLWGPELKKASIADRLANLLDTPSDFLPASNKGRQQESSRQNHSHPEEHLQVDDLEDSFDHPPQVPNDDTMAEEDSFFGQVTPRTKITALGQDEGEKTYMSRVAAEKERVAKIRKARTAAELIQRNWRKYKRGY